MQIPTQDEENQLYRLGYYLVAGVDEVGRGCIAGPVVAASVILPHSLPIKPWRTLIRDSKTLSPTQRELALSYIEDIAIGIGVGAVSPHKIDQLGIVNATHNAMKLALNQLSPSPQHLLVDAIDLGWRNVQCKAIIKGDSTCLAIAAASIVAKVSRDHFMASMDTTYTGYGFARHKGYPTKCHIDALRRLGPCQIHRRSFAPVRDLLHIDPMANHR